MLRSKKSNDNIFYDTLSVSTAGLKSNYSKTCELALILVKIYSHMICNDGIWRASLMIICLLNIACS